MKLITISPEEQGKFRITSHMLNEIKHEVAGYIRFFDEGYLEKGQHHRKEVAITVLQILFACILINANKQVLAKIVGTAKKNSKGIVFYTPKARNTYSPVTDSEQEEMVQTAMMVEKLVKPRNQNPYELGIRLHLYMEGIFAHIIAIGGNSFLKHAIDRAKRGAKRIADSYTTLSVH